MLHIEKTQTNTKIKPRSPKQIITQLNIIKNWYYKITESTLTKTESLPMAYLTLIVRLPPMSIPHHSNLSCWHLRSSPILYWGYPI